MKQKIKRLFTIHYSLFTNNKGFTLIEIAIVLIILGILIALGATLIGPLTKRSKYNETKDIVSAAVESVISYGASNKKLPCGGLASTGCSLPSQIDFTSDVLIDEFVEIVRNPKDAWTKTLYYVVEPNLTTIPAGSTDAICGRKTTDLIVCRDVNCTDANKITNVAFVVISGADNYNVQTGIIIGGTCPSGKTCVRVYEVDTPNIDDCTNSTNCPNYPAGEMISRAEPYDDIVKWVTLDELRIKAGCVGAQLRILNNELPFGTKSTVYATAANPVRIIADGGVPFPDSADPGTEVEYKWCIQRNPASAPPGLSFRNAPDTANIIFNTDCSALAEGSWVQSDNIIIYGTPNEAPLSSSSNYTLTFFVRDNNDSSGTDDNITQKAFVLTINPAVVAGGCAGYRVWNDAGGRRDYLIDGFCRNNVANNSEITDTGNNRLLNPGESIVQYQQAGTCNNLTGQSLTYDQAMNADGNKDCCVNFTGTDRACP